MSTTIHHELRPSPLEPPVTPAAGRALRAAAAEIADLRRALRESRARLRQGAVEGARRICVLNAEIVRLEARNEVDRRRLERYESGVAIVELGRQLMRLSENNARLAEAAGRVWALERRVAELEGESRRQAAERDAPARMPVTREVPR